jgi:uncharacterized membrane protein
VRRFAWIIVAAISLLVVFALIWSFTHLDQGTTYFADGNGMLALRES